MLLAGAAKHAGRGVLAPKQATAPVAEALSQEEPSQSGAAPPATSAPAAVAAAAAVQQPEPVRVAGQTTATATLSDAVAAKPRKGWSDALAEDGSSDDEDEGAAGFEVVPQAASEDSDASSDDEDAKLNALDADGKAEVSMVFCGSKNIKKLWLRCILCTCIKRRAGLSEPGGQDYSNLSQMLVNV